ncbi:hypothetical protein ACFL6L_01010 [candidate division KSB1 bacterium]
MENLSLYKVCLFIGLALIIVLLPGCSEDALVEPDALKQLKIESIDFPDTVWSGSDYTFPVRIKLSGTELTSTWTYISGAEVTFSHVQDFSYSFNLLDDGIDPDIVPNDKEFSASVSSRVFAGNTGTAVVTFHAGRSEEKIVYNPASFNTDAAETETIVVNEALNVKPVITHIYGLSSNLHADSTGYTVIAADITDSDGVDDIISATAKVYFPYQPSPGITVQLNDDGADNDAAAGDGRFTGRLPHDALRTFGSGIYTVLFYAADSAGNISDDVVQEISVVTSYTDIEPEIVRIIAPDSIKADDSNNLLQVVVADQNGLNDILEVYFISTRPNGTSSGTPFSMYDDGVTLGDDIADDGIYSLIISIPSTTTKGSWIFTFYVVDKSLNQSSKEHIIVVY